MVQISLEYLRWKPRDAALPSRLDILSVSKYLAQHVNEYGSDPRRLLVALMNCIYESEVHELYTQIQLQRSDRELVQITLNNLRLTPSDCLSIGCFLKHTKIDNVMPVFIMCNVNNAAFKMLLHQIIIKQQLQYNPRLDICLDGNPITHKGLEFIREGLGNRRLGLQVSGCFKPSLHPNTHVNIFKALCYLIEGLSRSVAVFSLRIGFNEITAEHKFYLLLLTLFSKSLVCLELTNSNLRESMPLLAPALSHSNLETIILRNCYLDDNNIICLGRALHRNFKVTTLDITENNISPHAFSELLLAVQYSTISTVAYDGQITVAHKIMLNAINHDRFTAMLNAFINSRCTALMPPLHLQDSHEVDDEAVQCGERLAHFPPEFLTGQKGTTNPYL